MIPGSQHTRLPTTEHALCSSKIKKDHIIPKFSGGTKN